MPSLFGEFDQNLALIEHRFGVEATARGNLVLLSGPAESREMAAAVLESLYARIASGESIVEGDVEGAIRLARARPDRTNNRLQAEHE